MQNLRRECRSRLTIKQPARPHLRSRGSSAGVKASAGRRRPLARGRPSGASRQLLRRKQRWKRVKAARSRVATIEAARAVLEKKSQAEDVRWAKEQEKLESALRRARE